MADDTTITNEDEGKAVIDSSGEKIGVVTSVRGDTAYVDPDPGLTDQIMSKMGWGDTGEEDYPLPEDSVETVTDDDIRLQ